MQLRAGREIEMGIVFFPRDGSYLAFPGVFATWLCPHGDAPNPCRKYHVSSDISCAAGVAAVALPILRELGLYHKVVRMPADYARMQTGNQAGKFITIYAPLNIQHDALVSRLGDALSGTPGLRPSPTIPRSRRYRHVFAEQPLDRGMFVYGGFETDPGE
ncbi:MAG TPA: hypothetical protein VMP03_06205 [Methylomirabilota bacterium]|nr:hypothetical protein [Methylomirabilota bacterium]